MEGFDEVRSGIFDVQANKDLGFHLAGIYAKVGDGWTRKDFVGPALTLKGAEAMRTIYEARN